jgi:hypothetical protein
MELSRRAKDESVETNWKCIEKFRFLPRIASSFGLIQTRVDALVLFQFVVISYDH